MAGMDAYAHLLQPGDEATVVYTGKLTRPLAQYREDEAVSMRTAGGRRIDLVLPAEPGVHLVAGDLTHTLLSALQYAIDHLGKNDPEWVAPETLAELEQYERALDALRGGYADEKTADHCV